MSELQTKIQQFFANQINLQKMKEVLTRNNVYSDVGFRELISSFMDGDRDISMIGDYLIVKFGLPFETAEKISDELMDAGLSEIYFDVYQNYTEHQKEMAEFAAEAFGEENEEEVSEETPSESTTEPAAETEELPESGEVAKIIEELKTPEKNPIVSIEPIAQIEPEQISVSSSVAPMDLAEMYQQFSKSSLFSNALEAEKTIKTQSGGDAARLKNIFYESVNAADVVKVVGALRVIFGSGVKNFFVGDNRYADFMSKYLSRSPDNATIQGFNNNPTDKKYIISFIRLILEKKLHLSEIQSAMIGVSLGSLARSGGEEEFVDVAYGDEEANKFLWNQ